MGTIRELFDLAVRCHQAKDPLQAEALCRRILQINPAHAAAHQLLGLSAHQTGQPDAAIAWLRQAINLNPTDASGHFNLGIVFMSERRYAEAGRCFRHALQLEPGDARAHYNLGSVLHQQGQNEEAAFHYGQAVAHDSRHADAYLRLGMLRKNQGRLAEAIVCYRQALAIDPLNSHAHNNLGNALSEQGQLAEALPSYRQALQLDPQYADANHNLGAALFEQGDLDEARECYRQALRINPGHAEAHNNLGILLKDQGQLEEALACFQRARERRPDHHGFHSAFLGSLHFHPGYDARAIFEEHRRWYHAHARELLNTTPRFLNDPSPDRRLRIGYVSADFSFHPVGRFLLPLLEAHDRDQAAIYCYASVRVPDQITEHCRALAGVWRPVFGMADECLAQMIRADQIDILVDLSMHTENNRLLVFARKPAPVQVTYLAYCGTTGLDAMDYRLTDPYLDPPGQNDALYAEESVRLPQTFWCYQPPPMAPEVNPSPAFAKGHVTFGCLNNFSKVTEPTLAAWRSLLKAVPQARLLLHAKAGSHRDRVRAYMAQEHVGPERITFVGKLPVHEYFQAYQHIDIALDPFPYGGGTTTCDALWMGVPVVSLAGRTAVGRGGLSILSNIGLADLVASSPEEYVSKARQLASNLGALGSLRIGLRDRMRRSPLMDAVSYAHGVERAYGIMWRTWCAEAENDLAVHYQQGGEPRQAEALYQHIIECTAYDRDRHASPQEGQAPTRAARVGFAARFNLGVLLTDRGAPEEAAACFREALRIHPGHADAHVNLGIALAHLGLFGEALEQYEQALQSAPGKPPALWQRSLLRLLKGDFENAWQDFECRLDVLDQVPRPSQAPRWDGSPLAGKTILVYAEQGLGDTVQFLRYLPLVQQRGGIVLFQCQPALMGLVARLRGINYLVPRGAPLPSYDVEAALLSLPRLFGTTLASIPAAVPYLYADPQRVADWRKELAGGGLKVGIAWQGNPKNKEDRYRSLPLARFEPVARVPGVLLFSLQLGPGADQLADAPFPIADLGKRFDPHSLEDLAAVMMSLDLVITVETAVAHLAGALGVPVWALLTLAPDWRWLLDRADSPWYPSMRLFRQKRFGAWDEVLARVVDELRPRSENK